MNTLVVSGVGGIEAEAVMLGQSISMVLPQVVGYKITGKLGPLTTSTDVVLTVTKVIAPQENFVLLDLIPDSYLRFFHLISAPAQRGCRGQVRRVFRTWRRAAVDRRPRHHRQHVSRVRCHGRLLPRRLAESGLPLPNW